MGIRRSSKIKVISIVLFLSVLIMLISCQKKKTGWEGKIEYKKGVKVINNPVEPLCGQIQFELEEDLSIGREDDENYTFYDIKDIVVDNDENIFILDKRNFRIQKYDKNGNYLQTIGREGKGPGEFSILLLGISLDPAENIYVIDYNQIHVFDKEGEFKNTIKLSNIIHQMGIMKDGNILALIALAKPEGQTRDIVLFNPEWKIVKTIASFPLEGRSYKQGIRSIKFHAPRLSFWTSNEGVGIYGYSSEYKLFVINSSGELVHIIKKDEPLVAFTKKEKDYIINDFLEKQKKSDWIIKLTRSQMKFAVFKPYYYRMIQDDKERIYVLKLKFPFDKEEDRYYDLFDNEGYYLYRVKMPILRGVYLQIINNGYIYGWKLDEDTGYIKVKRYMIKNWEQIRER